MSVRDQTTGPVFSSGWWVSIDFLRHVTPNVYELASAVHLPVDEMMKELDRWAQGPWGFCYGVTVDIEDRSYKCAE